MISGSTGEKMKVFIPYTTFYDLYKRFWIKHYEKISKIVNKDLLVLFSNIKIRLLSAQLHNPTYFKNITLFIDGHDGKIKYYDPDTRTALLYSYKFKGPGLRTQIVCDMNKMILFISKSEKCAISNDGVMFTNMKLENVMHIGDCLGMDGGYTLFVNKYKEKAIEIGKEFSDKNFVYPIRKEEKQKLTIDELDYNKRFGSFRSDIENHFSVLASKFNRFNNNRGALQITKLKHYNIQFKTVCLLKNIWQMVETYNIEAQPHHMLWYNDNYEFPKKETQLDIVFRNKMEADDSFNEMIELQKSLLNLNLEELENLNTDIVDIMSEDENMAGPSELPRKKSRKGKEKEVVTSINITPKYQFPN
jgi:hypothetical protein